MGYVSWIMLLFVICFLMIGTTLYNADIEQGTERDIYNFTENYINFEPINFSSNYEPLPKQSGLINTGRLHIVIESFTNFMLVSTEQVSKMGIEYGYQNPNINYEKIFEFLTIILIVYVIVILIKPIGYLVIFLILIIMWIKEKIDKRRKRKRK